MFLEFLAVIILAAIAWNLNDIRAEIKTLREVLEWIGKNR